MTKKAKPSLRHKARRLALQALYQWGVTEKEPASIIEEFRDTKHYEEVKQDLFEHLVYEVCARADELDGYLAEVTDTPLRELTWVEIAAIRIAVYEFLYQPQVPYRVVINEALELTKTFGTDQGYRFVNGVLDRLARQIRIHELEASGQKKR